MNYWTGQSIAFANQRNYLDELFKVYPLSPNIKRELNSNLVSEIEKNFSNRNDTELIKQLLKLELFPVKDSYAAFLRKDKTAIDRNPNTVSRLASYMYDMGLAQLFARAEEPKETNRQMGQLFRNWLNKELLGVKVFKNTDEFLGCSDNAILNISDGLSKIFATEYLGYTHSKGLDFIARFNNKYVVGEAKFLTDNGGHQNAQFFDALAVRDSTFIDNKLGVQVIPIAILDGVLYIQSTSKMFKAITNDDNKITISALCLREFLYSL